MSHPLPNLREMYQQTEARMNALQQANDARRAEAQEVRAEMEAEALAGNTDAMRARMDDLEALNQAYESNRIAQSKLQDELQHIGEEIKRFYADAAQSDATVDWSCRLEEQEKALRSDWGGPSYRTGHVCLIDVELCAPELCALVDLLGTRQVMQERDRLRVRYNEYRNMCWADMDGARIVKALAPILDKGRCPTIEMTEFVEKLAVLA